MPVVTRSALLLRSCVGARVTLGPVTRATTTASSAPFGASNIRTAGFFKIREINIEHSGCEDFIFGNGEPTDLKTEGPNAGDLDERAIAIEVSWATDRAGLVEFRR